MILTTLNQSLKLVLKQVKFTGFLKNLDEFLGIKTKLGEIIPSFIGQGLFTTLDQLVDDISAVTIAERRLIDATKDTGDLARERSPARPISTVSGSLRPSSSRRKS